MFFPETIWSKKKKIFFTKTVLLSLGVLIIDVFVWIFSNIFSYFNPIYMYIYISINGAYIRILVVIVLLYRSRRISSRLCGRDRNVTVACDLSECNWSTGHRHRIYVVNKRYIIYYYVVTRVYVSVVVNKRCGRYPCALSSNRVYLFSRPDHWSRPKETPWKPIRGGTFENRNKSSPKDLEKPFYLNTADLLILYIWGWWPFWANRPCTIWAKGQMPFGRIVIIK